MKRPWLAPLTPLYAAAVAVRNLRISNGWEPVQRLRFPVVSIGNLSAGGSGKTPLTITLARALTERGFHVDVLSRGYGRKRKWVARVLPNGDADDFGDEPLLIAHETGVPVYVGAVRFEAGRMAEAGQMSSTHRAVHLLDDGFQHRQLHRKIDILLLSRSDWNDHILPAGNLREGLSAIRRASVIAIPSDEPELEASVRSRGFTGPIWRLRRTMEIPGGIQSGPIAAFCGIAHPGQFFVGLESAGMPLAVCFAFPDHHRYTPRELNELLTVALRAGATALLTTEKDLFRLGANAAQLSAALPLHVAALHTEIEDAATALTWLVNRLV